VICGYKHANFWCNRDEYGLKRRVTVRKSLTENASQRFAETHLRSFASQALKGLIVKVHDTWNNYANFKFPLTFVSNIKDLLFIDS